MNVLGLDVGGANIKGVFLRIRNGRINELRTSLQYFPIWKNQKKRLTEMLWKAKKKLTNLTAVDVLGVTITAELSDAYLTKKEGINHVLDCVTEVFEYPSILVLDVDANLLAIEDARRNSIKVASANWAATGWMISKLSRNCIIIDVGTTTTSIIPIVNGKVIAKGKTDLEKLGNGELVYSGSLRTNIATIVNEIPIRGNMTKVSSEMFAQSGDVHLLLDNIEEKNYTVETCDGRGKTRKEAAARLARVICADMDMMTEREILKMAKFVYEEQVDQIACGLRQVNERINPSLQEKRIIVAGLGRNFLARKAAEKVGFKDIIDIKEMIGKDAAILSPSFGVALMAATMWEGKNIEWKLF